MAADQSRAGVTAFIIRGGIAAHNSALGVSCFQSFPRAVVADSANDAVACTVALSGDWH